MTVLGKDGEPDARVAVLVCEPDTAGPHGAMLTRLRGAGLTRLSTREWTTGTFTAVDCSVYVDTVTPPGHVTRIHTGRSSIQLRPMQPMTELWMSVARQRGRVMIALVEPGSFPEGIIEDVDLTADPDQVARMDSLAEQRKLYGGLARLSFEEGSRP